MGQKHNLFWIKRQLLNISTHWRKWVGRVGWTPSPLCGTLVWWWPWRWFGMVTPGRTSPLNHLLGLPKGAPSGLPLFRRSLLWLRTATKGWLGQACLCSQMAPSPLGAGLRRFLRSTQGSVPPKGSCSPQHLPALAAVEVPPPPQGPWPIPGVLIH